MKSTRTTSPSLRDVSANRVEAVAIEQELQSRSRPGDNYLFPAQNVDEARMKADTMRPVVSCTVDEDNERGLGDRNRRRPWSCFRCNDA